MKTTVELDEADYRRIEALAHAGGATPNELIQIAVAEYLARRAPESTPRSLGMARSGDPTLARRSEQHLDELGTS